MKISRPLYLLKLWMVIQFTFVNLFFIVTIHDLGYWIIAIMLDALQLFMFSLSWFPDVWAKENNLASSLFGFKKDYDYEDITKISQAEYGFRYLPKQYNPVKLVFRDKNTLTFNPSKDGLAHLLKVIEDKSLKVRIED